MEIERISDVTAERILHLKFGELGKARHDEINGAIWKVDPNTGLEYGVDSFGLYWHELDLFRYRYFKSSVIELAEKRRTEGKTK